jgi:hypothetical protein
LATIVVSVVLLGLLAVPALAATTVQEGYAPNGDRTEVDIATTHPQDPGDRGELPFTGLDAVMVGGAGVTLLLTGIGMSRAARRESRAAQIP